VKVSVVTVSFNAGRTIGHTLESLFAQTHPDQELVVVDGGSTDDTLAIVESFCREGVQVVSERDRGLYDAMNKGLRRFAGDAVGFLNADDRYNDEGVLADISAALEEFDIVYGDLDFIDDHESDRVVRTWRGKAWTAGAFQRGWMPPHPTFYVRRRVAEQVGEFDLALKISSDYDYMLRAMELGGFSSRFLPRVMVRMMTGGASTAGLKSYLRGNLEALRARRRWLGSGFIDAALLAKPLGKVGQFLTQSNGH
jgi:glycosyltransferase involved in cell wall biosynthesis